MNGHSKFLQWAREEHNQNQFERDAFNDPYQDFDDYIFTNIDFLIQKYNEANIEENINDRRTS